MKLLLLALALSLCACTSAAPRRGPDLSEDALLKGLLAHFQSKTGYLVVAPLSETWPIFDEEVERAIRLRGGDRKLEEALDIKGLDVHELLERFHLLNKSPIAWHLPSDRDAGYVVGDESAYVECFEKGGGGWCRWNELNPGATGIVRVSRPAIDDSHRFVLLYYEFPSEGPLSGSGWISVFRIGGERLVRLKSCEVWIS